MYNEFGVPHEVLESRKFRDLQPRAKVLYMTLCKHRNRYGNTDGWFYRRLQDLADDTGLTYRSTLRAKRELLTTGFIERQRGHYEKHGWRGSDWYQVNGYQSRQSAI